MSARSFRRQLVIYRATLVVLLALTLPLMVTAGAVFQPAGRLDSGTVAVFIGVMLAWYGALVLCLRASDLLAAAKR